MSPLATVELEHLEAVTIVEIRGEIDVSNGDEVQTAVLDAVTLDTRCLLLDLTAVEYFDSVGVRLSFDLEQRLSRQGITFGIVRPVDLIRAQGARTVRRRTAHRHLRRPHRRPRNSLTRGAARAILTPPTGAVSSDG